MEFSTVHVVALGGFLLAFLFGAIAHRARFCTMGAVSDWVNIGDTARLRAWFLAIGVAILGAQGLTASASIDLQKSIYLTTNFGWLGHLLGGLLFGVGMTLASGCGQRTLVLVGGGNLKSLVVLLVLAIVGYMTLRGLLAPLRIGLIEAANIDLTQYGMTSQSIASFVAAIVGAPSVSTFRWVTSAVVGAGLVAWTLSSAQFRARSDQIFAGASVGALIVGGWYVTGVVGADDFEPTPVQSFSFVAPVADSLQYLMTYTGSTIGFGVAAVFGVVAGSFIYAAATGNFRLEGFASREDLAAHLFGGALMGFGGVCALGCTIGQGITGISTLALGSLLTSIAIVFGAALTMKVQYYLLDRIGFARAVRFALADLRLLPARAKPKSV